MATRLVSRDGSAPRPPQLVPWSSMCLDFGQRKLFYRSARKFIGAIMAIFRGDMFGLYFANTGLAQRQLQRTEAVPRYTGRPPPAGKIAIIMKISVVICTYNRAASLARTLNSFKEMRGLDNNSWELILVDNNSNDITRIIVEKFQQDLANIKYVFAEKPGLSQARNCGLKCASGEIISFADDDVIFDQYWLANLQRAFQEYQPCCVGGKILPIWEIPKPRWLVQELYGILALLDLGDKPLLLTYPGIFGANFAVRAEMFYRYGEFDTNLGRIPGRLFAGEDTDFFSRLLKGGEKILYHPDVVVHHCISRGRISRQYFRRWKFDVGLSTAVRLGDAGDRTMGGVPYYTIKTLLLNACLYCWSLLRLSPQRFVHELQIIHDLSLIKQRIRRSSASHRIPSGAARGEDRAADPASR